MNKLCLAINAEESASVMAVIPRSEMSHLCRTIDVQSESNQVELQVLHWP
jgi:hypothetical protein